MKKNKTIIIAEIGVNHNGNINVAKKLINIAKKSGADYVKFQTFKTENLVCKNTKVTRYQRNNLGKKTNQFKTSLNKCSRIFEFLICPTVINAYCILLENFFNLLFKTSGKFHFLFLPVNVILDSTTTK